MSPLRIGTIAAIVVAGPPLWMATGEGDLTSWGAAGRGIVVALACAVGVSFVMSLIYDYEVEARKAEEKYLAKALLDQLKADEEKQRRQQATGPA